MVLDASLLNTLQYKVGFKSKVEQSREMSSTLVQLLSKREPLGNPRLRSPTLLYFTAINMSTNKGSIFVLLYILLPFLESFHLFPFEKKIVFLEIEKLLK